MATFLSSRPLTRLTVLISTSTTYLMVYQNDHPAKRDYLAQRAPIRPIGKIYSAFSNFAENTPVQQHVHCGQPVSKKQRCPRLTKLCRASRTSRRDCRRSLRLLHRRTRERRGDQDRHVAGHDNSHNDVDGSRDDDIGRINGRGGGAAHVVYDVCDNDYCACLLTCVYSSSFPPGHD